MCIRDRSDPPDPADRKQRKKFSQCLLSVCDHDPHGNCPCLLYTSLDQLDGREVLKTIEGADKLEDMMKEMLEHIHDDHDEDECCDCLLYTSKIK